MRGCLLACGVRAFMRLRVEFSLLTAAATVTAATVTAATVTAATVTAATVTAASVEFCSEIIID